MIRTSDDAVERGVLLPLVTALVKLPSLADPTTRSSVTRLLADELREPLTISDHPNAVVHLSHLAEHCTERPKRWGALLRILEMMEDESSRPMQDLRRHIGMMHTLDLFEPDDLTRLLKLLGGIVVPDIAEIYRAVAGDAASGLGRATTYVEVFAVLENLNSRPDGIPRPIVFIEHVAVKVRKDLGIELRLWVDEQAAKREIAAEVAALRENLRVDPPDDWPPRPGTVAYLLMALRGEGPSGDLYRLTPARHLGVTPQWSPRVGTDRVGSLEAIQAHVAELVEQAERDWAAFEPDIRVEFALDRDNINLAVDQWPADNDETVPEPLGSRYQVVVRSLERNSDDKYLRVWRKRWRALAGQARTCRPVDRDGCVRAQDASQDGVRELRSMLSRRHEVVALLLSGPPKDDPEPQDEITSAVKAGVPLILWHRKCGPDKNLVRAVEYLLHDEDDEHPFLERVRRARATAFGERHVAHPCGELSVLYDDPMRRVLPHRAAPPEEVAVG
ncbi:hypothetical protein AB0I60_33605 [Actinosynnema sp. NPDC050436]|uniref:VMAP-C domain-containing protein n=1 Tax=Actinosynnema sp. NPDC050436 TaxID=3155659 RepID=UPI0034011EB9